jgi:endonuclease/exonuclease/phosphatase family metal-dependent hydrolase
MAYTICTFNCNNLYARYKFGTTYPGDRTGKSFYGKEWGYLPLYHPGAIEVFNERQRALAGAVLKGNAGAYPDVICLQEVESVFALRKFNEEYLGNAYDYAVLIDSHDERQIDVGVLSRLPVRGLRTHVDDRDKETNEYIFSRDCLEVQLALGRSTLTLFVNHLKSKYAETPEQQKSAAERRRRQALAVLEIVRKRFPGRSFQNELFTVVGDFNDQPDSPSVAPLLVDSGLERALDRIPRLEDRWTYWYRSENRVSQIDHILLSPALSHRTQGRVPRIDRRGVSFKSVLKDGLPGPKQTHFFRTDDDPSPIALDFRMERLPDVSVEHYASDHCPVFFDLP